MSTIILLFNNFKNNTPPRENFEIEDIQYLDDIMVMELKPIDESDGNITVIEIPTQRIDGDQLNEKDIISVEFDNQGSAPKANGYVYRCVNNVKLISPEELNGDKTVVPMRACADGREYVVGGINHYSTDYSLVTLHPQRWDNEIEITLAVSKRDIRGLKMHIRIEAEWDVGQYIQDSLTGNNYQKLSRFKVLGMDDHAVKGIIPEHKADLPRKHPVL